ncbi:hypothetical protein ACSNOI_33370 [Actinomadura kijaniata]|uniref:hypothetical protein n=1 Tax=Actinomadura kijaniata TaxID=46161 RepID=UPI003F1CA8A5
MVLTAAGLTEGMVLGSGVRIRTVQAKDVEAARQLIALTGSAVSLEGELAAAVRDGTLGAVAMQGLTEGPKALTHQLAAAVSQEGPGTVEEVVLGLTCVLVAEHSEAGVVGALLALPPARALSRLALPEMEALVGLVKVVKLKAVAVDPAHRSSGIAAALIATCRQLYTQLGYLLLYGRFRVGSGLETYYR